MAIGPVGQSEALSAARPLEGQASREASRVREDLQQNVPVKDAQASSPGFVVQAEGSQQASAKRPTDRDLAEAVKAINQHIQTLRRELQFNVDEKSGRVVIKVVDLETQDVIRQIPPEEVLALCQRLPEDKGLLLKAEG